MRLRVTESRESVLGWWRGSTSVGDRQGRDDERGRAPVTGRQLRSVRGKFHECKQAAKPKTFHRKAPVSRSGCTEVWIGGLMVG